MKKILIVIQIFLILILCGCAKADELGNNDIIVSFYVNYSEYTLFEISAEILNFEGENKSHTETAYGETVEAAYANLMKNLKKVPYAGHTGVLVFGDGLCINGLSDTISFFSDINIISPNINLMLTEDAFNDFKPNSIYEAAKSESLPTVPLYSLFIPENRMTVIPVIKSTDGEPEKSGGIIAEEFQFRYYFDEKSCMVYRLLTNSFKDKYYDSNEILKSKCKIKNKDGILKIQLKAEIKNLTKKDNEKIGSDIKEDIKAFSKELKKQNLCGILKNGDFNDVDIEVKLTIPDTGKLKEQEAKNE